MLHYENHNHNPKIKQTRQFFPSPEQFDFWGYVFITYHPRFGSQEYGGQKRFFFRIQLATSLYAVKWYHGKGIKRIFEKFSFSGCLKPKN